MSNRSPRVATPSPKQTSGTPKSFALGTHRVVAPAATLARVRGFFGPFGISRVATVTGLDHIGIPVVMVCRPNSRSLAVSQGKGVDIDAARASGVMEAIELYHAERITLPLKLASWAELRHSHQLVAVEQLSRTSLSSFGPTEPLLWIEGADLLSSSRKWLPYELVHVNYTLPFPPGTGCFVMSSNGLASGNHLLEATIHGLCEVIERDAVTLLMLSDLETRRSKRIDLDSVVDVECRRLLELYRRAEVLVGIWDATSDVGIPTFYCAILDRNPNAFRRLGQMEGMGCHPVREVALLRALTEAAQARLTLIAGSRDDNGRTRYEAFQDSAQISKARAVLIEGGTHSFENAPSFPHETLEEDVGLLLRGLTSAGLTEVMVVDLTKPEFNIPVVRVVVPGLETYHHVQGYVPGARARSVLDQRAKAAQ